MKAATLDSPFSYHQIVCRTTNKHMSDNFRPFLFHKRRLLVCGEHKDIKTGVNAKNFAAHRQPHQETRDVEETSTTQKNKQKACREQGQSSAATNNISNS